MKRIALCILIVSSILAACTSRATFPPGPTPTSAPSRVILSPSSNWHEVWRRNIGPSYSEGAWNSYSLMAVSGDTLLIPIWESAETTLFALSAQDGHTLWTQRLVDQDHSLLSSQPLDSDPGSSVRVDSVFADNGQVYVALPFGIKAFRLNDGKLIWKTEGELPSHTGYYILPEITENTVTVYGVTSGQVTLYAINIHNGQIQSTQAYSGDLLLKTPSAIYMENPLSLSSLNPVTKQKQWDVPISSGIKRWPTFYDSRTLMFAAGPLMAVDTRSGQALWKTSENIVSNFTLVGSEVYSLRQNAVLVSNDMITGHETGRMAFSGGPFDINHASEYWVAASGKWLSVYLGDSKELIGFQRD